MQFVSCMNPTAGSFTINPRLQVKPCSMAWGFGWIVQAQGSGEPGPDPAVVQSVEAAWICAVTVIPDGEAAPLLPSSFVIPLVLQLSGRSHKFPDRWTFTFRNTSGSDRQIFTFL